MPQAAGRKNQYQGSAHGELKLIQGIEGTYILNLKFMLLFNLVSFI